MKLRTRIYFLKNIGDKPNLSIDLMRFIAYEDTTLIKIDLPSGSYILNKYDYVNKNKIYDTGKEFFILADKHLHNDCAFKWLMNYAIEKLKKRMEKLNNLKVHYEEMVAA